MNNQFLFRALFTALFFVSLFTPISVFAQSNASAKIETVQFESKLVGAKLSYRVVLPVGYEAKEAAQMRYPVLYLLHGLGGHFDNWTDKTKLAEYAANYKIIVVTPEGNNAWYSDSVANPTEKYESYIIEELFPDVEKRYRAISSREGRAIAGLSMGGYGAMKFGLKYPEKFVFAGSLSGALKAAAWTEQELGVAGNWIKEPIMKVFGDYQTGTRKQNDVYQIVKDLTPEKNAKLPFVYLDCGTEDFLYADNVLMMQLLASKKVKHEFRQLPGAHNWAYWDKQVQEVLRLSNSFFSPT